MIIYNQSSAARSQVPADAEFTATGSLMCEKYSLATTFQFGVLFSVADRECGQMLGNAPYLPASKPR